MGKISKLVTEHPDIIYAHVFAVDNETKLKEPCAILLPEDEVEVDTEELRNEINEAISNEIGDHNRLGEIYTVTEMHNRFDWNVAAQIIKKEGQKIVPNMEEDYAEILDQLP